MTLFRILRIVLLLNHTLEPANPSALIVVNRKFGCCCLSKGHRVGLGPQTPNLQLQCFSSLSCSHGCASF